MDSGLRVKVKNQWDRGAYKSLPSSLWRVGWDAQLDFTEELLSRIDADVAYLKEK